MASKFKALIFDLGGVLLDWDPHSVKTVSSSQLRMLMHSTAWYDLDRGNLSLDQACEVRQCQGALDAWMLTDVQK